MAKAWKEYSRATQQEPHTPEFEKMFNCFAAQVGEVEASGGGGDRALRGIHLPTRFSKLHR